MTTLCVRQVRTRAVQAPLEYTLKTSTGVAWNEDAVRAYQVS